MYGLNHHLMGSLLPQDGTLPAFLQLYIIDIENEVRNRINAITRKQKSGKQNENLEVDSSMTAMDEYGKKSTKELDENIVAGLVNMLGTHNWLSQKFRMWRDRYKQDELDDVEFRLIGTRKRDARQYNLPTTSKIAGFVVDDPESDGKRDIIIQEKNGLLKDISELHPSYMALQYPLLFPYGEDGFHIDIPYDKQTKIVFNDEIGDEIGDGKKRKNITMREYYAFIIQQRAGDGQTLLRGGRLFQQYVVNAYATIEQSRLQWVKSHQKEIRCDLYNCIKEAVRAKYTKPASTGRVILPSTFTGGPRYMIQHYQDAIALCRELGPPDLFITFTCNPNWPEIAEAIKMFPGQKPSERPDIISRVFHIKPKQLMSDLVGSRHFGEVQGALYTVEFQKRGLPHARILLRLSPDEKPRSASHIGSIISVEIPNPKENKDAYDAVCNYMLHGPCGHAKPNSPCMRDKKCTENFPKKYNNKTYADDTGGMTIKYLFKCIHKGKDMITAIVAVIPAKDKNSSNINNKNSSNNVAVEEIQRTSKDEVNTYLEGRYLSGCECIWRTLSFKIHYRNPSIERLPLHIEGEQLVYHNDTDDLRDVLDKEDPDASKFIQWMKANRDHEDARKWTYKEFPKHWRWDQGKKHGKGYQNYDDNKTVGETIHPTFKSACLALGLLEDDGEWHRAIREAAETHTGKRLRELFVIILLNCKVTEPKKVWNDNWDLLAEDIKYEKMKFYGNSARNLRDEVLQNYALQDIEKIFWKHNRTLKEDEFKDIPYPDMSELKVPNNTLIHQEMNYDRDIIMEDAEELKKGLNAKQALTFNEISKSVEDKAGWLFFVYRSGGTGKTYLWRTLTSSLRSQGKILLAVASSGIASLLLTGGRTAHSRFKIPMKLNEISCCNLFKKTPLAELLCEVDLIIWDEAPMIYMYALEAVQRALADLMMEANNSKLLFGKKTLVLGGDFRQILPVIKEGTREDIVNASISKSRLWKHFTVFELTEK
ncbi:uncharacterized protein LOC113293999 [Papaver somniferum]|uniref:uncharacterized protein LOC113293999 n=1 Tax=Papaver somniferum TaxID=3469 RepID=UPI000E705CA4|nr:uncharacterized protein LOC113293999 [Papaver somniferum]